MHASALDLEALAREFGPAARDRKLAALQALADRPSPRGRRLRALEAALEFLRAYPDDAEILARVRTAVARLPATARVVHPFSYDVARRLSRLHPEGIEIAWDELDDEGPFLEALGLLVNPVDQQGLDDEDVSLQDWCAAVRPAGVPTDLALFLHLLERSGLPAAVREFLFTRAGLPLAFTGPVRPRIELPGRAPVCQAEPIPRAHFPIRPVIETPLPRPARGGQDVIDLALRALAVRALEIYPLIHASAAAVRVHALERGIQIAVVGVEPQWRTPLESLWFFLVLKNGAPIAYGPAGIFCGVCEMGINVFPEFRGAEIRLVDALLMRVLHQAYGARHFHLVPYAMGRDNPDAIRSGAFWFYRKLGFVPTNPGVEALARAEEARMAEQPGHRSDRRMLHRLSDTAAMLDLSGGRCRPFPFGALGLAHSAWLAREFAGDRARAARVCAARIRRRLGIPDSLALAGLAPLLCQIEDLAGWPRRDLDLLGRILAAKSAPSESAAEPLFQRLPRLENALRALAGTAVQD
ncbi:MAG: hypothetical protein IT458_19865 [Planctomycetes bacterium]|nr:hypothetical protein [Planctomycetota bacterium]